jgi:hypothetical protein
VTRTTSSLGVGTFSNITVADSDPTTRNSLNVEFHDPRVAGYQAALTDNSLNLKYYTLPNLQLLMTDPSGYSDIIVDTTLVTVFPHFYTASVPYSPTVFFSANTDMTFATAQAFWNTTVDRPVAPQSATILIDGSYSTPSEQIDGGFLDSTGSFVYEPALPSGPFAPFPRSVMVDVQYNTGALNFQSVVNSYSSVAMTIERNLGTIAIANSILYVGYPDTLTILQNLGTVSIDYQVYSNPTDPYVRLVHTVNVRSNAGTINVNDNVHSATVGINDQINLGDNGSMANVEGAINLSNTSAAFGIALDDRNNPAPGRRWIIDDTHAQTDGFTLNYAGVNAPTQYADIYSSFQLFPNAGSTIDPLAPFHSFMVQGTGNNNTLILSAVNPATWELNGLDQGRRYQAFQSFTWTGMQNLAGSPGDDTFIIDNGARLSGSLDGGGGNDSLQYDSSIGPVAVDLLNGTAPLIGGTVHNIKQVTPDGLPFSPPDTLTNRDGDSVDLALSATSASGLPLTYSASNLPPGLSIDPSTGIISGTITEGDYSNAPYNITVSVTDGANARIRQISWTIMSAVTISSHFDDATKFEGDVIQFAPVVATRNAGNAVTITATGLPDGLSINPTTGVISGVIAANDGSDQPYQVTMTASDGIDSASQTFLWTVHGVGIDTPSRQVSHEGDTVSLTLSALSFSGDPVTFSVDQLPPGLTLDPATGLISGTITGTTVSAYTLYSTITATRGSDTADATLVWTILPAGAVDVLSLENPGDQTNFDGDSVFLPINFSSSQDLSVVFDIEGLPGGLDFFPTYGSIYGAIAPGASIGSPYHVTVTASDGASTQTVTFDWNVSPTTVVQQPNPPEVFEGDQVSVPIYASGATWAPLTYGAFGLPAGLSIDPTTGVISGTVAAGAAGNSPYSITILADDGTRQAQADFNWSVGLDPQIENPGDQANQVGDTVSLPLIANSIFEVPSTFAATGLPPGLSIDPHTGLISGVDSAGSAGSYMVTVTANDGYHQGSDSFAWSVAPEISPTSLADQSTVVGTPVNIAVQATSNRGLPLTYSASGLPAGLAIDPVSGVISGTIAADAGTGSPYTSTITATDGVDTSSSAFTWTVTRPVIVGDVNNDGIVNGQDIALVASNWLNTGTGVPGDANVDGIVNGQDIALIASNWLATLPTGGAGGGSEAATIVGGQTAGESAASIGIASSPLWSASVLGATTSTGIGTSASGVFASSSALLGLPAPTFSSAPSPERVAAFTGRPDVTTVAATIDDLFSEGTGGQSHPLGPWARPAIMSLAKSQSAAGWRGAADADFEPETVGEPWGLLIDDDLLTTLAASRR